MIQPLTSTHPEPEKKPTGLPWITAFVYLYVDPLDDGDPQAEALALLDRLQAHTTPSWDGELRQLVAEAIAGIVDDEDATVKAAFAAERAIRARWHLQALTTPERGTVVVPRRWVEEAVYAMDSATIIGNRSCRPGDGLHVANHDRLIAEAITSGWTSPFLKAKSLTVPPPAPRGDQ